MNPLPGPPISFSLPPAAHCRIPCLEPAPSFCSLDKDQFADDEGDQAHPAAKRLDGAQGAGSN
jgi:hypothetical protein